MSSSRSSSSKARHMVNNLAGLLTALLRNETTEAEQKVRSTVIAILGSLGMKVRVYFNPIIVDQHGRIRRPDICIPALGLIIEVDGKFHDQSPWVIRFDGKREEFYLSLGFQVPFVISNHDAINDTRRGLLLNALITDFFNNRKITRHEARHLCDRITSNFKKLPDETHSVLAANDILKADQPGLPFRGVSCGGLVVDISPKRNKLADSTAKLRKQNGATE